MKLRPSSFVLLLFAIIAITSLCSSQQPDVPQVFRYTSTLPEAQRVGTPHLVGIIVRIYTNDLGGSPLWMERFDVVPDANWRVSMLLGSTGAVGLPATIFADNAARWVSLQADGFDESSRAALISVPYALKARDADTLGGLPASAFLTNPLRQSASSDNNSRTTTTGTTTYQYITAGAINVVPKFINATDLGGSQIIDTGVGVGVGTATPQEMLDVQGRAILRSTSRGPAGIWLGTNDPTSAFIGSSSSDPNSPMVFSHGGIARLTILSNGRIGVGTASPSVALDVLGDIRLGSGALFFSDGTWLNSAAGVGGGSASISAGDSSIAIGTSGASTTVSVAGQGVTTAKLADNSVVTSKIADGSITATKFAAGALSSIATLGANTFAAEQIVSVNTPTTPGISSTNLATTGTSPAIYGETFSTNGTALKGRASAPTGQSVAVYALNESSTGYGIYSLENATSGASFGVYGQSRHSLRCVRQSQWSLRHRPGWLRRKYKFHECGADRRSRPNGFSPWSGWPVHQLCRHRKHPGRAEQRR